MLSLDSGHKLRSSPTTGVPSWNLCTVPISDLETSTPASNRKMISKTSGEIGVRKFGLGGWSFLGPTSYPPPNTGAAFFSRENSGSTNPLCLSRETSPDVEFLAGGHEGPVELPEKKEHLEFKIKAIPTNGYIILYFMWTVTEDENDLGEITTLQFRCHPVSQSYKNILGPGGNKALKVLYIYSMHSRGSLHVEQFPANSQQNH